MNLVEQFILDTRERQFPADHRYWDKDDGRQHYRQGRNRDCRPGPSRVPGEPTQDEKANRVIQEVEAGMACICNVPGNENHKNFIEFVEPQIPNYKIDLSNEFVH